MEKNKNLKCKHAIKVFNQHLYDVCYITPGPWR